MHINKSFLFDMDGTIVDNLQFHLRAWEILLEEFGFNLTDKQLTKYNSGTITEVTSLILKDLSIDADICDIARRKDAYFRDIYDPHATLLAGVLRFLQESEHLHIPMALASSSARQNIDFILDRLLIRSFFQVIVSAEDVTYGKPNPECFLTAASELGVSPIDCIVFEDSLVGAQAAYAAGMRFVAIATTHHYRDFSNLPGMIAIVDDFIGLDPKRLEAM